MLHSTRFLAVLSILGASFAAHADTYTFSLLGSGSLGDTTFTNQEVTITAVGGTPSGAGVFYSDLDSTVTIDIDGIGTFADTDALKEVFVNQNYLDTSLLGFSASAGQFAIVSNENFADYALAGNIGPYSSTNYQNEASTIGTSGGVLNLTGLSSDIITAQATAADSIAATPEPSSIALLGTGLLGAAGALRRRFV